MFDIVAFLFPNLHLSKTTCNKVLRFTKLFLSCNFFPINKVPIRVQKCYHTCATNDRCQKELTTRDVLFFFTDISSISVITRLSALRYLLRNRNG